MNKQYSQCIQSCNRWLSEFDTIDNNDYKYSIYGFLGSSYLFGVEDYDKALLWYQKQLSLATNEDEQYQNFLCQAWCYDFKGDYRPAIKLYQIVLGDYFLKLEKRGITHSTVIDGKVKNEDMGNIFYNLALCEYGIGNYQDADFDMISSALLGNQKAQNYCIIHHFKDLYPGQTKNIQNKYFK